MSDEVNLTSSCFMGACGNFHRIWVKWYNTHNLGESVLASLLPAGRLENIYFVSRILRKKAYRPLEALSLINDHFPKNYQWLFRIHMQLDGLLRAMKGNSHMQNVDALSPMLLLWTNTSGVHVKFMLDRVIRIMRNDKITLCVTSLYRSYFVAG